MLTRYGVSQVLADARYLRKDAAATDQTIAGTGTVTISNYRYVWSTGSLTVSAGSLTVVNPAAIVASIQRSGADGTAFQVGNNITLSNFTVTAAGAGSFASTLGVTGATTLSSTLAVTGLSTLTGGFAASAASTITTGAGIVSLIVNDTAAADAGVDLVRIQRNGLNRIQLGLDGNGNGLITTTQVTAGTFTSGGATLLGYVNVLNFMDNGTIRGFLTTNAGATLFQLTSNVAAGANPGFTFNAANSPNIHTLWQQGATTFMTCEGVNKRLRIGDATAPTATLDVAGTFTVAGASGNTVIGSSGPTLSKAATSAALSVRNATATLADLNLNVLGGAPATLQDGDFWITDAAGIRRLNARIAGVTYGIAIT